MPADDSLRHHLRLIIGASERPVELTRRLMAYVGKGPFITERIDLSELIREILVLIQSSIPKKLTCSLIWRRICRPSRQIPGRCSSSSSDDQRRRSDR
jgi:hypothetical protein